MSCKAKSRTLCARSRSAISLIRGPKSDVPTLCRSETMAQLWPLNGALASASGYWRADGADPYPSRNSCQRAQIAPTFSRRYAPGFHQKQSKRPQISPLLIENERVYLKVRYRVYCCPSIYTDRYGHGTYRYLPKVYRHIKPYRGGTRRSVL